MTPDLFPESARVPQAQHRRILSLLSPLALCAGFLLILGLTFHFFGDVRLAIPALIAVLLLFAYEYVAEGSLLNRLVEGGRRVAHSQGSKEQQLKYPLENLTPQVRRPRIIVLTILIVTTIAAWIGYGLFWNALLVATEEAQRLLMLLLAQAYWIYGLIALAFLAYEALRSTRWSQHLYVWVILASLNGLLTAWAIWLLTAGDLIYSFGLGALSGLAVFWAYANQRLWIAEQARYEVMRQISLALLARDRDLPALREEIPRLIQERLRYDNLFIILLTQDRKRLRVIGQAGNYKDVRGEEIFLTNPGVTTRAVNECSLIECKDTRRSNDYIQLVDHDSDTTRSELAVPIIHKDRVFGVLDVQGLRRNSFGREDRLVLQSIASALGAALAVNVAQDAVSATASMWGKLPNAHSGETVSEQDLFRNFEPFAIEHLGATPILYYPLSPTGFPISSPYFNPAQVLHPEYLTGKVSDLSSPLITLINRWKYYESSDAANDPIITGNSPLGGQSFIHRERIKSSCFVPVGYRDEPLGALFLNFRYAKEFDDQFRLLVSSFANAVGLAAWRTRYEQMVLNGFGRPELYVHNVIARYGLKLGFRAKLDNIIQADGTVDLAGLHALFDETEDMIDDIRKLEAAIPPSFRGTTQTLRQRLENFSAAFNSAVYFDIDPRIEKSNPLVLTAIYGLVTEAINNAFFHAKANRIAVLVRLESGNIEIRVQNNGNPLVPGEADHQGGRHGIGYLRKQFEQHFDADFTIRTGDNATGAVVRVKIPALPYRNRGDEDGDS